MATGFPTKANYAAGDILTAANMNDLSSTLNTIQYPVYNAAGKNVIINGAFDIWQRGTSFTLSSGNFAYNADRFATYVDGTGFTATVTQQAQTPGAIAGYESQYFYRYAQTVAGTGSTITEPWITRIEDARTFAGQTVTFSFYAKADAARTVTPVWYQGFGSGGSAAVTTTGTAITLTTSWARYTQNITVPSVTGKTIGSGSFVQLYLLAANNTVQTIDLDFMQCEAGSTASGFQTATGTKQGELAACQRYYQQLGGEATYQEFATAAVVAITTADAVITFPVTMRVAPTVTFTATASQFAARNATGTEQAANGMLASRPTTGSFLWRVTVASGLVAGNASTICANNSTAGRVYISAEL